MNEILLNLAGVENAVSLKRTKIYQLIGEGKFPRPVSLGGRCVRWRNSEVQAWIDSLPLQQKEAAA